MMNEKYLKKRTKEAERLCNAIAEYFNEYHYSPTIRELCKRLDVKSTCTLSQRLSKARELGYVDYSDGEPRTIVLKKYDYKLTKKGE